MNLELRLGYAIPVGCALLLTLGFPASRAITDPESRKIYRRLQLATLFGAVIGAKLAALWGDLGWPDAWVDVFTVGRSVTGGLIGGFLTAEILKPLFRYREPPNDRFAAVLPFSLAIGRVGCFIEGCCAGTPWNGPWALADEHGVLRHPAQLYELFFQLAVGILFVRLLKRERLKGRLFALYLVIYGLFRFATEFVRDTPRLEVGISRYQILALVMIALGAVAMRRSVFLPQGEIAHAE